MPRKKLLFLSDSVSSSSGLGRITRDLALRVHQHLGDVFEVGTVGYGGSGSASIPFKEYHLHSVDKWLVPELPAIWNDFTRGEEGVLMSVWDLSRLYWLGLPHTCIDPNLRKWVETAKMKKWAYHAIDAEGPNGKLPHWISQTMTGFDRVLDYSEFSSRITGNPQHLPHGVDSTVFKPYPLVESRKEFAEGGFTGLTDDSLLIGIVATNQARKNWALGIQTARMLLDRGHNVRVWAHTDMVARYWDLGHLIVDYGLVGRVAVTTNRFSDAQMAKMYSACDVTLSIAPEGFGFSSAESLACGIPTVAGRYGAQAEFVPKSMQVEPNAYFHEGAFCSKRPVHSPEAWAFKVEKLMKNRYSGSLLPPRVDWNEPELWTKWSDWFLEGI
jgi:glycosyltransferase involved in cell wall biosynthesis